MAAFQETHAVVLPFKKRKVKSKVIFTAPPAGLILLNILWFACLAATKERALLYKRFNTNIDSSDRKQKDDRVKTESNAKEGFLLASNQSH